MTTAEKRTLHQRVVESKCVDERGNPCPRATAEMAMIGIDCPHGHDVCPACDPCTCGRCEVVS